MEPSQPKLAAKTPEYWLTKEIRERKTGEIQSHFTGIHGTEAYHFLHPLAPVPIGTLWVRQVGNRTIEILEVYVPEHFRRARIASRLLSQAIAEKHPRRLITGVANSLSGPWLQHLGFTQSPDTGDWLLDLPAAAEKSTP